MYEVISSKLIVVLTIFVININFITSSAHRQLVDLGYLQTKNVIKEKNGFAKTAPSVDSKSTNSQEEPEKNSDVIHEDSSSSEYEYEQPKPSIPWGQTEKLAEHTYRIYVGEDEIMSSVEELHAALNKYRANHGVQELVVSDQLCKIADFRIAQLDAIDGLDAHKGFKDYLSDDKNWENIPRFSSVGENSSYGYILSGTHLIEWVFDADEEHRSNQQNPKWNRVCVRISGTIVEMVFGEEK